MGLFDKLKDRVADKLVEQSASQGASAAKAAAKMCAEALLSMAKDSGRKLEEALFGEREELPAADDAPSSGGSRADRKRKEEARKHNEEAMGERLRAADRRVKERAAEAMRAAEAKRVADESEEKRARVEQEVDAELAALKKKLDRR
jgi:hypothetical protein